MEVIFLNIKAKNAAIVVTMASVFNDEIWKKNDISLRFFCGQSTNNSENPVTLSQARLRYLFVLNASGDFFLLP